MLPTGAKKPATIVTYHSVGDPLDPYTVSPTAFTRQVRFIRDNYSVRPLQEISEVLTDDRPDSRVVFVTFDDGLLDFYDVAYPILREYDMPSTVFVPSGFIGKYNGWDADAGICSSKPMMTDDQLRILHETGLVSIGSHTVDHVCMARLSKTGMKRQAKDSKKTLEDLIGSPVTMFAYPYGQLADFSSATTEALLETGYSLAVTSHWGTLNSLDDILRLRRISFAERDGERVLKLKCEGWHDWVGVKERAGHRVRRFRERNRFCAGF